jgi:hypothetical protein
MALPRASWMLALVSLLCMEVHAGEFVLEPDKMPFVASVDERFQSYNIEMVEITGGKFWKPYSELRKDKRQIAADKHSDIYSYRPPIELGNSRLRKLAAALSPAYLRVSGTWANTTYFADTDHAPTAPPVGFNSVLSRAQWRGVIDFARVVDARLVTSFAISGGTRDGSLFWKPDQARSLLAFTHSLGASVDGAEYMNEPTLAAHNGAPSGYDAAAYGRDFRIFREFARREFPKLLILAPGAIGEIPGSTSPMRSEDLLASSGAGLDIFSYHHYRTISPRCGGRDGPNGAMSEQSLARTDRSLAFYRSLRDRFEPRKPIWLTETADAACGGNSWDSTYLDSFRYLDQLGRLAKASVQVVMHNTLAASDYGLLDERTFRPRPNYWSALLWHRLMGRTVLSAGIVPRQGLHVYAHCHPTKPGGVSILAINMSRKTSHSLALSMRSERYTLRAPRLQSPSVQLNGATLTVQGNDEIPATPGMPTSPGQVRLAPATITFLAIPAADNRACQ